MFSGEIASLELKSMGGYRLLVNETGIHPQEGFHIDENAHRLVLIWTSRYGFENSIENQTKMISLFSTYYQDNPLEDYKLSAALLYGNILIQKWTNSKSKNKIRFMFEDGNLRTSQSRIPQGPSLSIDLFHFKSDTWPIPRKLPKPKLKPCQNLSPT